MNVRKRTLCAILALAILVPLEAAAQQRRLSAEQWLNDLQGVVRCMRANHPDLHYRISQEELARAVDVASREIEASASDEECAVAIMKVVAAIQDGHTHWVPEGRFSLDRWYPLRVYSFQDGVFVTAIDEDLAEHVGSRVLTIGGLPAYEAWNRLETVVPGDNDFMRLNRAAIYASNSEVLFGLGIAGSPDEIELEVQSPSGSVATLRLRSFRSAYSHEWFRRQDVGPGRRAYVHAFSGREPEMPLHLKHAGSSYRNYWFELMEAERTLYMQMNIVRESEIESFADFRERMWATYDARQADIDRFVLDLRYNNGGMGLMLIPFLADIIKRDDVNQRRRLFVLVGRGTYSAAVILMSMMYIHTEVIFVGEPPACAFNLFSDARTFRPEPSHSGGHLRMATVHFHLAWPQNEDYFFPPHYPAPFSSDDYFSGRDPALEAVLAGRPRIVECMLDHDGALAALEYYLEVNQYDWGVQVWYTPGHSADREISLNRRGYELLRSSQEEAVAVFELNALLFPDSSKAWNSLGEGHMINRDLDLAVMCYERSLELDPENANASERLREIAASR